MAMHQRSIHVPKLFKWRVITPVRDRFQAKLTQAKWTGESCHLTINAPLGKASGDHTKAKQQGGQGGSNQCCDKKNHIIASPCRGRRRFCPECSACNGWTPCGYSRAE